MSDELFLDDEAMFRLTGYRQKAKQVAQLRKERIPFHLNRSGHPRVARAVVEGRKVAADVQKSNKQAWSPSWAASAAST